MGVMMDVVLQQAHSGHVMLFLTAPLQNCCLQDMAAFVDAAHGLGMGVMMDVVLHHGAPSGNMLWDYDGWEVGHNGGIYHEGAPDCMWGRYVKRIPKA
jgi:hypothetical protein